jgi:hypothetical protein
MHPMLATMLFALASAALLLAPAAASACAVTTPATVATDLHLTEAQEIPLLLTPGPFWSVDGACTFDAWSGSRPVTSAQIQAGFAAGTYAVVQISTWAPASGLFLAGAQLKGFRETLATARRESRTQLLTAQHGSTFKPPRHGAQAVGWKAIGPTFRVARGLWWSRPSLRIMMIGVRGSRKRPATAALDRIAASAVPAFGL